MTKLLWDEVGKRTYETGVDHGVLYLPDSFGVYEEAYAWNGLTAVTESPEGAEATAQYADNIKYLNLVSAEEFKGTIEAFTYPNEFGVCDGTAEPEPGVYIGQQTRKTFGFSYRTLYGNDIQGTDYGYKLHLVYGALASVSEKAYATVNDSPEAITFSWEFTTTAVAVPGFKPSATIVIDSTKVDAEALADLEDALYGTEGSDGRLPLPDEVFSFFEGEGPIVATPTAPTYDSETKVITIPTVAGIQYKIAGVLLAPGAQPAITEDTLVRAYTTPGYKFPDVVDDRWLFEV